jgi:hypothetical protein
MFSWATVMASVILAMLSIIEAMDASIAFLISSGEAGFGRPAGAWAWAMPMERANRTAAVAADERIWLRSGKIVQAIIRQVYVGKEIKSTAPAGWDE